MATYYIDPNKNINGDGSENSPFNSLTGLPTLVAGDVVNLKPGSVLYVSSGYTFSGSGSSGNPIIFQTDPSDALNKATIKVQDPTIKALSYTSRSYITTNNIKIEGDNSNFSQTSNGFFINGAGNELIFNNCDVAYVGVGFVGSGGFNRNGIILNNCTATFCNADGVRFWAGDVANTWETITISGGTFSNNGTAKGGNGSGIIFYKYNSTHEFQVYKNILIENTKCENNFVHGIALLDAQQYPTLTNPSVTIGPTHRFNGILIKNNISSNNGGGGIVISCGSASEIYSFIIENNTCWFNSKNTTLGSIWTGACLSPLIQRNKCYFTSSIGDTVGDGEGIFDDQWNDGAVVRWNVVANGIFNKNQNPEYTAYGIGIYRATNSLHYGNVVVNCRYGYIIGTVPTSTHPIMSNIRVINNSFISITKKGISLWSSLPSSSVTVANNCFVNCEQPMEAHSVSAGNQTILNNWSYNSQINSDGSNIPDGGNFFSSTPIIFSDWTPQVDSNLIANGTFFTVLNDFNNNVFQNPPTIGAFEYIRPKTITSTRTMRS